MAYDDRAKALAARMLAPKPKGKGQVATITVPATDGEYDPETGTTTAGSPPQELFGSGIETSYDARSIDGTIVQRGDVKFLLSPAKTNGADMPAPIPDFCTLTKADGLWAIKNVAVTAPAGMGLLFELQLRRS